jgi:hypothetical protein
MDGPNDLRTMRLLDLAEYEVIEVICECGRVCHIKQGYFPRHRRVSSDSLIYDLRYRLRCTHCNLIDACEIAIIDTRGLGDHSKPENRRVIVPKRSMR